MTIKQKVELVLKELEDTRNSDKELIRAYVKIWHTNLVVEGEDGTQWLRVDDLLRIGDMGTVTRIRRKFQEAGMYEASEAVKRERGRMADGVSDTINDHDWAEGWLPN